MRFHVFAEPELTPVVIAPGIDLTSAGERRAGAKASSYRDDIRQAGYERRRDRIRRRCAEPELTIAVVAPGVDGAIGKHGEAVPRSRRHGDDIRQRRDPDWPRAIVEGPITELAAVVRTPREQAAVVGHRQRVIAAGSHLGDAGQRLNEARRRAIRRRAVANLTVVVVAPRVEQAVRRRERREGPSTADRARTERRRQRVGGRGHGALRDAAAERARFQSEPASEQRRPRLDDRIGRGRIDTGQRDANRHGRIRMRDRHERTRIVRAARQAERRRRG
jgi:hypothetical protein